MAAHEALSDRQFIYRPPEMGREEHSVHTMVSLEDGRTCAAGMSWNAKGITGIHVPDSLQRQGIGTALWNEGHRLASENAKVPAPKHSSDRTDAGDAWARSVGGRLPRRKKI